jgi:hypothetical protein
VALESGFTEGALVDGWLRAEGDHPASEDLDDVVRDGSSTYFEGFQQVGVV